MILYKYSGDSGIRILDDLRLKLTPPDELNDPFEITPRSRHQMRRRYLHEKAKNDPEHFRSTYLSMVKDGFTGSFEEVLAHLQKIPRKTYSTFLRMYREKLVEMDMAEIKEASKFMVVFCLSAVPDSIPMWSHYANHHKGIVVGFDAGDRNLCVGSPLCKVVYSRGRVVLEQMVKPSEDEKSKKMIEIITTKSRDWEYEREFRLCYHKSTIKKEFVNGNVFHFIDIYPSAIKELIFGCWISQEYESRIREILSMRQFSHVKLFRTRRHKTRFALDVIPA